MARKKARKPAPVTSSEPRKLPPELQAKMDRLVENLAHLILMKINPTSAKAVQE